MIEFKDVTFSFPDTEILEDVSFTLNDGEFIGLLGPNGGGKTTFLRLILRRELSNRAFFSLKVISLAKISSFHESMPTILAITCCAFINEKSSTLTSNLLIIALTSKNLGAQT